MDYSPDKFNVEIYEVPTVGQTVRFDEKEGFDRAGTLRLVNHATVWSSNWRYQLVRAEFTARMAENEVKMNETEEEECITKQSMLGALVRGIKTVLMIHQHQLILQIQFGSELMLINQNHRIQYPGFTECGSDCILCRTEDLMIELEQHMAVHRSSSRPEPFGEIGANVLEKIMLEARDTPLFLLNTSFIGAMYLISLELVREELPKVIRTRHGNMPKVERLWEIYRFITRSKFEMNDSLENLAKFNLVGRYPSAVNFFREEEENGTRGRTICVHMAINLRGCTSLTSKIPQRFLSWDGNKITLPYAVPKNIQFQSEIKAAAYENGLGIGDRKIRYPEDKYDEKHQVFYVRPTFDDTELNNEVLDLAVYCDIMNNAQRLIIV